MNSARANASVTVLAFWAAVTAAEPRLPSAEPSRGSDLPARLSETGLYLPGSRVVRPDVYAFAPQYALWSDGAAKRRWIYLPPGAVIDGSRPDAWAFPAGTRLWKEFGHGGEPIETRVIEHLGDGSWRYATYVWDALGDDAVLAPSEGLAHLPAPAAPGGGYAIPSRDDCLACHEGTAVPVLGFSAVQLPAERDPFALRKEHAGAGQLDLRTLIARGLIDGLPQALLETPPRIDALSPETRAALGYLHANCGHCHNDTGPLALLELNLAQSAGSPDRAAGRTLQSLIGYAGDFRMGTARIRVSPGEPAASVVALRMRSRDPLAQMPPLGTQIADERGIALVERWIQTATH